MFLYSKSLFSLIQRIFIDLFNLIKKRSLFSGIQSNTSLNELHLNLSSNDLGSCLKSFSNEIGKPSGLTSLDLSENSKNFYSNETFSQITDT